MSGRHLVCPIWSSIRRSFVRPFIHPSHFCVFGAFPDKQPIFCWYQIWWIIQTGKPLIGLKGALSKLIGTTTHPHPNQPLTHPHSIYIITTHFGYFNFPSQISVINWLSIHYPYIMIISIKTFITIENGMLKIWSIFLSMGHNSQQMMT